MGLFSGVKKIVSKAAPVVGAGLGAFFGGPGGMAAGASMGSAVGGMLGGGQSSANDSGSMFDTGLGYANSAMDIWGAYNDIMNTKDAAERNAKMSKLQMGAYDNSLQGIMMQNASAKQLADEANAYGRENMAIQNQYNRTNAEWAKGYELSLANTAHQREAADLQAAGLNRILSGTGGMGATTPTGGVSPVSQSSTHVAPVRSQGDAITSAFSAFTSMADAMKATAATNYMQGAQTANTEANTRVADSTTAVNATRARLNQDQSLKIASEIQNIKAIRDNIPKSGALTDAQTAQAKQSTNNLKQIFRDLRVKGDISEQDQAYWNGLINQSGGSAAGTMQLLNSLRQLLK